MPAQLFRRELDSVLRRGLVSGYHHVEQTDVALRGRLRIGSRCGPSSSGLSPGSLLCS
ncbi:5-methylcytosine restriction system specificity protein McrC [Dietzia aurantiaca]|uniref:Uncharacterized protein n=1 Tax=Dietzia aurantiaca TaxID=983873 RepID=A0ABV9PMQ4_9ACTN